MKFRACILWLTLCATGLHAGKLDKVADFLRPGFEFLDDNSGEIAAGCGVVFCASLTANAFLKLITKKLRHAQRNTKDAKQRQKLKNRAKMLSRLNKGMLIVTIGSGILTGFFLVNKLIDDAEKNEAKKKKIKNDDVRKVEDRGVNGYKLRRIEDKTREEADYYIRNSVVEDEEGKILSIFELCSKPKTKKSNCNTCGLAIRRAVSVKGVCNNLTGEDVDSDQKIFLSCINELQKAQAYLLYKDFRFSSNKSLYTFNNFVSDYLFKEISNLLVNNDGDVESVDFDSAFNKSFECYKEENNIGSDYNIAFKKD